MTKTKMSFLALLLAPAVTFAATVTVDWSGTIPIDGYGAAGSVYPQTLSDTSISGVFTYNTNLLPPPDAGNQAGVVSFTGSGFLQSSVQWSGGPFAAEPSGSAGSNSLYIDTTHDLCTFQDSSTYMDGMGTMHQALLYLSVTGLLAANSPGSAGEISGNGFFADVTVPSDNSDPQGFQAVFATDSVSVNVQPVGVPEPDTASLGVGMLLAIVVASMRARRKEV